MTRNEAARILARWLLTGEGAEEFEQVPGVAGIYVPSALLAEFERKVREHCSPDDPRGPLPEGLVAERSYHLPNQALNNGAALVTEALLPALAQSFGLAGVRPEREAGLRLRRAPSRYRGGAGKGILLVANYPCRARRTGGRRDLAAAEAAFAEHKLRVESVH